MTGIPTPRTDAYEEKFRHGECVPQDLARQLERELAVALEALEHITMADDDDLKVSRTGMYRSAISAKQRIETMRRAFEEGR